MKARHRLIHNWVIERSQVLKQGSYWGFNNLEYRKFRILSGVFFALEKYGILPGSFGYPEFHFEYKGAITIASLRPIDPYTHSRNAALCFIIFDQKWDRLTPLQELSDCEGRLEDRVCQIVDAVCIAVRAAAADRIEREKSLLTEELFLLLDKIKKLDDSEADSIASRVDPRMLSALIAMAEKHHTAKITRRFLRSLAEMVVDRSTVVAGHSLDDWIVWAALKVDEFDPIVRGPTYVFEKIVKS